VVEILETLDILYENKGVEWWQLWCSKTTS